MGILRGSSSTDTVNEGSSADLNLRFKKNGSLTVPASGLNYRIDDLTEDVVIREWTAYTLPLTASDITIRLTSSDNVLYNSANKSELRAVTVSASFGEDNNVTGTFKYRVINLISNE